MSDSRFRRSAGAVNSPALHVVSCPRYRHRLLGGRVAHRLNELFGEVAVDNGVHVFARVRPTDWPAEVARKFEGRSCRVLRAEFPWLARRRVLLSKSYFVASFGYVSETTVRRYIEHQEDQVA